VAANRPVYSLRRIRAYDELQKSLQSKSGTLDRRLQHCSKHGDEYVGSKQGNLLTRKVTHNTSPRVSYLRNALKLLRMRSCQCRKMRKDWRAQS